MIEFRGVTKRFPDGTVAVDALDLTVDAGKITVFVGPSGCGKTTSLRMINRMIDASDGVISVDGRDITSVEVRIAGVHDGDGGGLTSLREIVVRG